MICPAEIKQKALRQYPRFCLAFLQGESFFPLVISGNKGKSTDPFMERKRGIAALLSESKQKKGYGFQLELEEVNTREYGPQSMIRKISFKGATDFLQFTGRERDFFRFKQGVKIIRQTMPVLEDWIGSNLKAVHEQSANLPDLLTVCRWFCEHPSPRLYIRELPLPVHTKFIEEHTAVLISLLDFLLPPMHINPEFKNFARRYNLQWDQPLIRCRFRSSEGEEDLSRPLGLFRKIPLPGSPIFIIENKMNFLTFPLERELLVIWGKGFAAEVLKAIPWLQERPLYYWGDIDPPGYEILGMFRSYYPRTSSFLMDRPVYREYERFAHFCDKGRAQPPENLTAAEREMFLYLKAHPEKGRLEQERISQEYLLRALQH